MSLTRDSALWWWGIGVSVVSGLATNLNMFPFIPDNVGHWITFAAFIVGLVSAAMKTSPLNGAPPTVLPVSDPSRFRGGPPAAAVFLVVALGATMVTSCAKAAPNVTPQVARQQQIVKVLTAVRRVGVVLQQVQAVEIGMYAAGEVPLDAHAKIQAAFLKAADSVLTATTALERSADTTDPRIVVRAVSDALTALVPEFVALGQPQAAQLAGWIDTASAILEIVLS